MTDEQILNLMRGVTLMVMGFILAWLLKPNEVVPPLSYLEYPTQPPQVKPPSPRRIRFSNNTMVSGGSSNVALGYDAGVPTPSIAKVTVPVGTLVTVESQEFKSAGGVFMVECKLPINVTVQGDCGDASSNLGSLEIKGNVKGNATSVTGNIHAGDIGGDAKTEDGDIRAEGGIRGSASSMTGDIYAPWRGR